MPLKGGSKLPSLFLIGGYRVYFWSNEGNEPVHVHMSRGKPTANSTKVWLTRSGGCILASNASRIPASDLNELLQVIAAQHAYICEKWKSFFMTDQLDFFC